MFSFLLYFYYFFVSFLFLLLFSHLRGDRDRRLDVVTLQVALEVQDRHLLRLRALEELAEGGIRVDVLLVVELVRLDVVHDATSDIRAAHLSALRLAEEDTELVRDLLRLGEDRLLLGERVARLIQLRDLRAAAATRLLDLARQALLQLLHISQNHAERVAEVVDLRHLSVELSDEVDLLDRLRGNRRGGGYNGRRARRNGDGRSGSLRRLALRGRGGGGDRRRHNGSDLLLLGSRRRLLRRHSRHLSVLSRAHFILMSGFI